MICCFCLKQKPFDNSYMQKHQNNNNNNNLQLITALPNYYCLFLTKYVLCEFM